MFFPKSLSSYKIPGLYYTYIHCDLENRKINVYKEYDCGGEVASYSCDIPDDLTHTGSTNTINVLPQITFIVQNSCSKSIRNFFHCLILSQIL